MGSLPTAASMDSRTGGPKLAACLSEPGQAVVSVVGWVRS